MKNTFEAKRNILKGSTDDCIAFGNRKTQEAVKQHSSVNNHISRVIQSPASYHITSRSQRLVHIFMYIKL